mgnify:FL=1
MYTQNAFPTSYHLFATGLPALFAMDLSTALLDLPNGYATGFNDKCLLGIPSLTADNNF